MDYSDIYRSSNTTRPIHGSNPKPKVIRKIEKVLFKIHTLHRKLNISLNKDSSLEDLYIAIYNAVYPELSTDKNQDIIPPPGLTHIPKIYSVSVVSDNPETIENVPLHRFITLKSYMQTKPNCFKPNFGFGSPTYNIYVIDEYTLANIKTIKNTKENPFAYVQKYFTCYRGKKLLSSS